MENRKVEIEEINEGLMVNPIRRKADFLEFGISNGQSMAIVEYDTGKVGMVDIYRIQFIKDTEYEVFNYRIDSLCKYLGYRDGKYISRSDIRNLQEHIDIGSKRCETCDYCKIFHDHYNVTCSYKSKNSKEPQRQVSSLERAMKA